MQKDISAVKTIVFLQEEYGCYGTSLVTTTATIEEIKRWWAEGGFHPCSGKDSGHFTRSLPGTEVFSRASIVWKKDLVPQVSFIMLFATLLSDSSNKFFEYF